ncbi:hypothetical protein TSMEX_001372 [Taenia solium]|eukprot:TsM_000284300 transcript=TsM_000284300 gene=TsM_000284300
MCPVITRSRGLVRLFVFARSFKVCLDIHTNQLPNTHMLCELVQYASKLPDATKSSSIKTAFPLQLRLAPHSTFAALMSSHLGGDRRHFDDLPDANLAVAVLNYYFATSIYYCREDSAI